MKELADDLRARRERARAMGGAAAVAKQHAEGKLTVRERLDLLFDADSFQEIGVLATHANIAPSMKGRETPADGVITGFGKVDGRPAAAIAYDFTVMAGSMGRTAEVKCNRAREIALGKRMPMIWLIDSAGARIQEAIGSTFAGSGFLFREESIMSGVVPMVAAMMGPGAAGTAYIPALERQGIIRHGAKMLYAVSEATVPKVTVVVRRAYGAGYFVMCGRAYEPDLIVAWPTAEISVMGPEGGTSTLFRKEIAASANPEEERARRIEEFRGLINPYIAAGGALIDDVIDPRETRPVIIRALEMARTKKVERPWKKHGVMPV